MTDTGPTETGHFARQLAELLSQVLSNHAAAAVPHQVALRSQLVTAFLEGLEDEHTPLLRPLLESWTATGVVPAELAPLLENIGAPPHQFGALAQQFMVWGVAFQLAGQLLAPFLQVVANELWSEFPDRPLSPADAADMVLRGLLDQETGAGIAKKSGVPPSDFALLVNDVGEPPGVMTLLEMVRRGLIPVDAQDPTTPSFTTGVRYSRVRDEWIPALFGLQYNLPTAGDVIDAAVESQIDDPTARELLGKVGTDPAYYDLLFHTRGRPPGPGELADAANRGYIPWTGAGPTTTTFEQGIAESAVKNKWTSVLQQLAQYLPPPRTVTALLRAGSITEDEALALFKDHGLSPPLAAAYVVDASNQKVVKDKELAKSEIESLYEQQIIGHVEATNMLGALGYAEPVAAFLLELQDFKRVNRFINTAVAKIHTLYVARKVDSAAATAALGELKVAANQITQLMQLWTLERDATVRILTEAQVVDAAFYQVISWDQAQAELVALGYTPYDAWVLSGVRNHGPVGTAPPQGPSPTANIT